MAEQAPTKATIPVQIIIIFDKDHYRCEVREGGNLFKAMSGDFQETDEDLTGKINKLLQVMNDGLNHIVASGTKDVHDYTVNSLIQPVSNVYDSS